MMFWLIGGAVFVMIFMGGLWWCAERSPIMEDHE